ncbi:MAG: DUF1272 domain-containing protein [Alphaproteobacteria bacterium]
MLELRPTCENCDAPLPPAVADAMICSFECTFCRTCAEDVLGNICPNCGGGFQPRPIRPAEKLANYPASTTRTHKPVDLKAHAALAARLKSVAPIPR